jgi:purine-binding chemotaxis protein CheW
VRTGVIVDAVSEVLKVPRSAFKEAPTTSEKQASVIQRVANLEGQKRMVLILETDKLFDEREIHQLSKAS